MDLQSRYDYLKLVAMIQDVLRRDGVVVPSWTSATPPPEFVSLVLKVLIDNEAGETAEDRQTLAKDLALWIMALGVLTPLLLDETINEIIVRDDLLRVERVGGGIETMGRLETGDYYHALVRRESERAGHTLTAAQPVMVTDLGTGDRLTTIVPPCSINGPAINIRKFGQVMPDLDQLVAWGALSPFMAEFLTAHAGQRNILLVGPSGSGKTTLLNALVNAVPEQAEVAILETFREMQIERQGDLRVVVPTITPSGVVDMAEVLNVVITRMRMNVIIVGELVAGEAVQFVEAMAIGAKTMSTSHAPAQVAAGLHRLERLILQYSPPGSTRALIREDLAELLDLVVVLDLALDGRRQVREIVQVEGLDEQGRYRVGSLYEWPG
ncbi:MAG: Flp pilus assembly complex ATPase component TadA [Chloroflexi bacterium]|nr:Flp pilus assembly complex ATPase component TadA [Chloroflexota bacterium]